MPPLRTPEERFSNLPAYPWTPHYIDVTDTLRMAYLDVGPPNAQPILCLHGEPSWSYLYRKMIPLFVTAGYRVIAPDLIGFGRSDKLPELEDYTYQSHVDWLTSFIKALNLQNIVLVCQDWGGLLGLRIAAENESRFAQIIAANTFLPTGDQRPPEKFFEWRAFSQSTPDLPIGPIIGFGCVQSLSPEIFQAYEAPFPDSSYKAGARQFPLLVPVTPDDPASEPNRKAWDVLKTWTKPFLTAFSDKDPITRGGDKVLQTLIPGCKGQPHTTIQGAGHFLQEDKGEELAKVIIDWLASLSR